MTNLRLCCLKNYFNPFKQYIDDHYVEQFTARRTEILEDSYVLGESGYLHQSVTQDGINLEEDYFVRGSTALLDAIGLTLTKVINVQKHTAESERAEHVLFVITTDGMENASREFSYDQISRMIECQTTQYGWEFIFLGANMDAIATATRLGIRQDRATNYLADHQGTLLNYEVLNEAINFMRYTHEIPKNWKRRIEEDYRARGGRK